MVERRHMGPIQVSLLGYGLSRVYRGSILGLSGVSTPCFYKPAPLGALLLMSTVEQLVGCMWCHGKAILNDHLHDAKSPRGSSSF